MLKTKIENHNTGANFANQDSSLLFERVTPAVESFNQFLSMSSDEQVLTVSGWRWDLYDYYGPESCNDYGAAISFETLELVRLSDEPFSLLAKDLAGFRFQEEAVVIGNRLSEAGGLLDGALKVRTGYNGAIYFDDKSINAVRRRVSELPTVNLINPDLLADRYISFWSNTDNAAMVQARFGVDMITLDFTDQMNVINFIIDTPHNSPKVKDLTEYFQSDGTLTKLNVLEAMNYGDEYGDILVNLYKDNDELSMNQVAQSLSKIKNYGFDIAKNISGDSQALNLAVSNAFIKRTTELLALAERDGLEAIVPTLNVLDAATEAIKKALNEDSFTIHSVQSTHGTLQASEQPVTITARSSGRNARIGFTVRGLGDSGKDRISIRLDYEDGGLSLDIGSTARNGVNSSDTARMVGETLARGESAIADLRAQRAAESGHTPQPVALHGNHVREAFSHFEDLQPEEFSQIVNRFLYSLKLVDQNPTQLETAA